MTEHARTEELIALRMGTLGGEQSRELLNHVAGCAICRHAAREVLDLRSDGGELAGSLMREEPRRRSRVWWLAAAALVAAIAVAIPLLRPRSAPPARREVAAVPRPAPPAAEPARPSPWEAMVRETLAAGRIDPPALLVSLQPEPDTFRARTEEARIPDMRPFAEIVESDRPLFRWPATRGATYTVIVGDRGRIVAQSKPLREASWRCTVSLPRGRTYRWQVEVRRGDEASMMPMPPAPNARFHVLDAKTKEELDAAPRNEPLVLGILYAKAGLREQALEQLDAAATNTPAARALSDSVRSWSRARR